MHSVPVPGSSTSEPADTRGSGAVKTIVVVEYDPTFLRLLLQALRRDYQVVVCLDSTQAHATVDAARPDVVIFDMPSGDAENWRALAAIKQNPETAPIPIIVCADPVPEVQAQEASLRAGGCHLAFKPFSMDELVERIRQLVS